MEWIVSSLIELDSVAREILREIHDRNILLLHGTLGAGKTTLVKSLVRALGSGDEVSSPTFSLVNEYRYPKAGNPVGGIIFHIDLYRLQSFEETIAIGIEEYLYKDARCFVEWPALIDSLCQDDCYHLQIEILSESSRKFCILSN
jgi:tRNA threonylcarbamoyladenosine biosynthesis protein TsaE